MTKIKTLYCDVYCADCLNSKTRSFRSSIFGHRENWWLSSFCVSVCFLSTRFDCVTISLYKEVMTLQNNAYTLRMWLLMLKLRLNVHTIFKSSVVLCNELVCLTRVRLSHNNLYHNLNEIHFKWFPISITRNSYICEQLKMDLVKVMKFS